MNKVEAQCILSPFFSDDDSWDLVTCFCMKPFAGRAMIECNKCNTWIHLSCAKIRKSHVPETYVCQSCRETHGPPDTRRSHRSRVGPRKHMLDWPQATSWTLTRTAPTLTLYWTGPLLLRFRSCTLQSLSFKVQPWTHIFYKHFSGPIPSPYPIWEQFECYFRFTKVCFCFLQTLRVRQSLNGCLSVDDISIATNRYFWGLVSREHWKHFELPYWENSHNCHPLWCMLGFVGKMVCTLKKKKKKIHLTFLSETGVSFWSG